MEQWFILLQNSAYNRVQLAKRIFFDASSVPRGSECVHCNGCIIVPFGQLYGLLIDLSKTSSEGCHIVHQEVMGKC